MDFSDGREKDGRRQAGETLPEVVTRKISLVKGEAGGPPLNIVKYITKSELLSFARPF